MPTNSYNTQKAAEQITRHNYHWGSSIGTAPGQITYGFRTTAPTSNDGTGTEYISAKGSFSPFTALQEQATRAALKSWSDVANITFRDLGDTNSATIEFANYNASSSVAGFAFAPRANDQSSGSIQGDVFMNIRNVSTTSVSHGTNSYFVLLHEIGHSLGLEHPGEYDGSGYTYPNNAVYIQDTRQYSLMSYFSEQNTGGFFYVPPETPMMHDIAAIQRLYGANMTTRTGGTVYGFNSNAGSIYLVASSFQNIAYCIWDAGGNDTLDFSGYSQNAIINLSAESFSSVGGSISNISIAAGVLIENARGGSGNDTIYGNDADNVLLGEAGNDFLVGGRGADRFNGGAGIDIVAYDGATAAVIVDIASAQPNAGDAAGDTFSSIENIAGSYDYGDRLLGDSSANTIFGRGGNDSLYGRGGDDILNGDGGNDFLVGGSGADRLNGGDGIDIVAYDGATTAVIVDLQIPSANTGDAAGDTFSNVENIAGSYDYGDRLLGNASANTIFGRGGNDSLYGRDGNDILNGDGGNDFLVGGAGADQLNGIDGIDMVAYDGATAAVNVDLINAATNTGDATGDTFSGIENIAGTYEYSDTLRGNDTANTLFGRGGNDVLDGRGGNDVLNGEADNDVLVGGAGADTLNGGAGDDNLIGGTGADALNGGDGNDVVGYDGASGSVAVDLANLAANTGDAVSDTYFSIEVIAGTYEYSDTLRGDSSANTFFGRGGNDILEGRGGADVLFGEAGNDALNGEADNDVLVGGAGADTLNGGAGDDNLIGGAGADALNGGDGNDVVGYDGAPGPVTVDLANLAVNTGDAIGDTYFSIEVIAGTYEYSDTLRGDSSANTFFGRGGNDVIEGRGGADVLFGEAGADIFRFRAVGDSTVASAGRDMIQDFSHVQGDRIDLHFMDANITASASGDQAFLFIGSAAFTRHAGELRAASAGSNTIVSGDVNGDGIADFAITIANMSAMQKNDFVL